MRLRKAPLGDEYKPIWVTDAGDVYDFKGENLTKKRKTLYGSYYQIDVYHKPSKVGTAFSLHYLVMLTFHPRNPHDAYAKGLVIEHIDQNKLNNRYSNLTYTTRSKNIKAHHDHSSWYDRADKKSKTGWKAILSDDDIKKIREEYDTTDISQTGLASKYGVSQPHICNIVNGKYTRTPKKKKSKTKLRKTGKGIKRPCKVIDDNGNLLGEFDSILSASESLGYSYTLINRLLYRDEPDTNYNFVVEPND